MKINDIIYKIKHSPHVFYVLYADSTELLDKAQRLLRPLPEGCELVRLSTENKNQYKCKWNISQMLSVKGEAWAVVHKTEIIAYHYGTYRGETSLFFKVKNCDYEHIEIMVDERFRRNGIAVYLLYHAIKNLNFKNVKNMKIGVVIRPDNIPSLKLHELIGFKKSHRVSFFHWMKVKDEHFKYINIPHYCI